MPFAPGHLARVGKLGLMSAPEDPKHDTCALCRKPILPGEHAIYRALPDTQGAQSMVRVHIVCLAKARIERVRSKRPAR